jgi:hypothetical protein
MSYKSGTYTIGKLTSNYLTWAAALADFGVDANGIDGNLTYIIEDEVVFTTINLQKLNGFTFKITATDYHNGNINQGVRLRLPAGHSIFYHDNSSGNVIIERLCIISDSMHPLWMNGDDSGKSNIRVSYNIFYNTELAIIGTYSVAKTHSIFRNKFINTVADGAPNLYFRFISSYGIDSSAIVKNNTFYSSRTGVNLRLREDSGYGYVNVAIASLIIINNVMSTVTGSNVTHVGQAFLTFPKAYSNRHDDNSFAVYPWSNSSDNSLIIPENEYLSTSLASADFLRIPSNKSLYATGNNSLLYEETKSIDGFPAPTIFNAVSIGAHEPNVVIDFTGVPLDPAIMDTVSFISEVNEATIPFYSWNLDDGKISSEINPIAAYTVPGLKSISLTAFDSGGRSATVTKPDYIDVHPYGLGFTAEPIKGLSPLEVKFTPSFQVQ